MTVNQEKQKCSEQFYVEEAAKKLGVSWNICSQESPDFIVTEDTQKFGLEVRQIFKDKVDKRGFTTKKIESYVQKCLDKLRCDYEKKRKKPLTVKILGCIDGKISMEAVLKRLVRENFDNELPQYYKTIEIERGGEFLKIYVTRSLRADWYSLDDRVGWVNTNPAEQIEAAIKEKSGKLCRYRENTGLKDIRLLLVADRSMNSGKLMFREPTDIGKKGPSDIDRKGFQRVYFYSYPEKPILLGR